MRILLALLVAVYYLLHQDWWLWKTARPLAFGFLPPGLFYHVVYAVGAAVVMLLLVKYAWPAELDREYSDRERKR